VKKSSVFEWYKWFTEGEGTVKDTEDAFVPKVTDPTKMSEGAKTYSTRRPFQYPRSGSGKKFGQETDRQNLKDDLCTKKVSPR